MELASGTGKTAKFVVTERVITVLTRVLTDVPMLSLILSDPEFGWCKSMVYVTPLYVLVCAVIVFVSDGFHSRGIDITGIEEMRQIANDESLRKTQFFRRFVRWFMRRESLIFWIGSAIYLDPDYVTLMLRKKGDSFLKTTLVLTLPSVLVSMVFWTTVYWLAYQPFKNMEWARWMAENL